MHVAPEKKGGDAFDGYRAACRDRWYRRLAAALPAEGLDFADVRLLMARIHWPEQHWWLWTWNMEFRQDLRASVKAGYIRFVNGKYIRPRRFHVLPDPPLCLPGEKPVKWPEQMKPPW